MRCVIRLICYLFFIALAGIEAHAQSVRISSLDDLSLGNWTGSGDLENEDTICIYNLGVSTYRVKATGSGAASAFHMTGSGGNVPYEVEFKSGAGSFVALTSNSFTGFSGADIVSDTCGGSPNATVKIIARAASLASVLAGSYSGTLTILLETN